jgi:hypothetical protein
MNKYTYYKVIQQNWGNSWDDVDFYETNSSFLFKTRDERKAFITNLNLYRTEQNAPVRVIKRKELNDE